MVIPEIYDDDVSLVGRRTECADAPGFLGMLLCGEPSLLAGTSSIGPPARELVLSVATGTPVRTSPGQAGQLSCVDVDLMEVADLGPVAHPASSPPGEPLLAQEMEVPGAQAEEAPETTSPVVAPLGTGASSVQAASTPEMLPSFIDSLRLPLGEPLVESTPIRHVSRRVSPIVPRRSVRIPALTHHRDLRPEIQAKKVMLRKWRPAARSPSPLSPDNSYNVKFRRHFREPLSSSRCEAMRELFPSRRRWSAARARNA